MVSFSRFEDFEDGDRLRQVAKNLYSAAPEDLLQQAAKLLPIEPGALRSVVNGRLLSAIQTRRIHEAELAKIVPQEGNRPEDIAATDPAQAKAEAQDSFYLWARLVLKLRHAQLERYFRIMDLSLDLVEGLSCSIKRMAIVVNLEPELHGPVLRRVSRPDVKSDTTVRRAVRKVAQHFAALNVPSRELTEVQIDGLMKVLEEALQKGQDAPGSAEDQGKVVARGMDRVLREVKALQELIGEEGKAYADQRWAQTLLATSSIVRAQLQALFGGAAEVALAKSPVSPGPPAPNSSAPNSANPPAPNPPAPNPPAPNPPAPNPPAPNPPAPDPPAPNPPAPNPPAPNPPAPNPPAPNPPAPNPPPAPDRTEPPPPELPLPPDLPDLPPPDPPLPPEPPPEDPDLWYVILAKAVPSLSSDKQDQLLKVLYELVRKAPTKEQEAFVKGLANEPAFASMPHALFDQLTRHLLDKDPESRGQSGAIFMEACNIPSYNLHLHLLRTWELPKGVRELLNKICEDVPPLPLTPEDEKLMASDNPNKKKILKMRMTTRLAERFVERIKKDPKSIDSRAIMEVVRASVHTKIKLARAKRHKRSKK